MATGMAPEILRSGPQHQPPVEAMHLFDEAEVLIAQEKYDEAILALDNATKLDPQYKLAWNEKANILRMLGRKTEANAAYDNIKEIEESQTTSILDHSMASSIGDPTNGVINKTNEFSVNDSKACSWLSLRNVQENDTILWNWYSPPEKYAPSGNLFYYHIVQIPSPTTGDRWCIYNNSSNIDIAGKDPANLPGDWHVDVFLNGQKILTEYFWISGGQILSEQELIEPEAQFSYDSRKLYEVASKNLDNQTKYDDAVRKGDRLKDEGRYDEAIYFYDEAIDLVPDTSYDWRIYWQVWNSKGDALSKQGKYSEALQAYDTAIELVPDNSILWANKGAALKALGRTDESDIAYASARELGDLSAWIPQTNATGINLTSLYFVKIADHCMASNVDESSNEVISRTGTFSSSDRRVYSWLNLEHFLGATVVWHWYSPDGNPYKTGQVDIERNPKGGYQSSYYVWNPLDIAKIPTEPYMSGNWQVDIYINGQKRLSEQFDLNLGSESSTIRPSTTPSSGSTQGTFTVLDHCMAGEIDRASGKPVTTTKTDKFSDATMPYSWLLLGNIGAARVEWHWYRGKWDIRGNYDIPPDPSGGYHTSYPIWDPIDIPEMASEYENVEEEYTGCINDKYFHPDRTCAPNPYTDYTDPHGDWTVDVYVNDQWILQEQFNVIG
jgi:tetratricopeptide (TPR) repeat protein